MSILVHSRDIFLSTQQSGSPGAGDQTFSRFRMCLNSAPISCENGQQNKLSLTQFSCFRNFYYINQYNCRVDVKYKLGGVQQTKAFLLDKQDYGNIGDIAAEFATKLKDCFGAGTVDAGTKPSTAFNIGETGNRVLSVSLSALPAGITELVIQTRQFEGASLTGNDANVTGTADGIACTSFGDSYVILGSKRIAAPSATAQSFDLDHADNATTLTIKGFYPMQKTSMQYMYLRCSEAADNLQSQNLGEDSDVQDSHMVGSQIMAKIPVSNEVCAWQSFSSHCPYFVNSSNRNISEVMFSLVDHHGRPIPKSNVSIETEGNLFSDLTLKVDTYAVGGNEHTLNTPVKNYNYETNQIKQIQGVIG